MWEELQYRIKDYRKDLMLALVVTLALFAAFGFGRATAPHPLKENIQREAFSAPTVLNRGEVHDTQKTTTGSFFASIHGTKYYSAGCAAKSRVKEENRVWFTNEQDAQQAGYQPSSGC